LKILKIYAIIKHHPFLVLFMTNMALKARLAVALAPGLSWRAWQGIVQKGLNAEEFIAGGALLWQSLALKPNTTDYLTSLPWSLIDECIAWQDNNGNCQICFTEDALYPELLKATQVPPKLLFLQGRSELLHRPQLAIVGSRNPTTTGNEWARHFARELAALGWVITSGLAQGIDGVAHNGALEAKGQTIAVLGTGLKRIYPKRHQRLSEEILQTGLLISEYPPSTPPLPQYFPARNRIISGLSVGVLVIEATLQSGSLITARFALQEGRQVYAIPGSLHNPLSKGCHFLIKEGAKLVETIDDILEETVGFAFWYGAKIDHKKTAEDKRDAILDKKALELLNSIDFSPTSFNAILMRTGLTVTEVSVILMALEIKGLVRLQSGGYERTA
jgi:DNA processing protein